VEVKIKVNVDLYSALSCVDTTILIHSKLLTIGISGLQKSEKSIDLIVE